jgi:hypothetical protein
MRDNIFDLPLPWGPWRNAMFAVSVNEKDVQYSTTFGERLTGYVIKIISESSFGFQALLPSHFGVNIESICSLDGQPVNGVPAEPLIEARFCVKTRWIREQFR